MWWKQHKWKVILPVLAAAVLAGAFWFGGGAPGTQGWTVATPPATQPAQTAASPSETPAPAPTATPAAWTPVPTEMPVPAVTAPPEQPSAPAAGRDQYQTEPVPEGKPLPAEPQDTTVTDTAYTCTISISCAAILDHMDWLDPEKAELVPEDGIILPPTQATFYEGESVFNLLRRVCKQEKIHLEFVDTPMYNSAYIEGIHNLYEFDCGELSGWMYAVNGWFPNYGCSRYALKDGDTVEWVYTCDLGADVGGSNALGG